MNKRRIHVDKHGMYIVIIRTTTVNPFTGEKVELESPIEVKLYVN